MISSALVFFFSFADYTGGDPVSHTLFGSGDLFHYKTIGGRHKATALNRVIGNDHGAAFNATFVPGHTASRQTLLGGQHIVGDIVPGFQLGGNIGLKGSGDQIGAHIGHLFFKLGHPFMLNHGNNGRGSRLQAFGHRFQPLVGKTGIAQFGR